MMLEIKILEIDNVGDRLLNIRIRLYYSALVSVSMMVYSNSY